jgi:hypothetical protein
MSIADFLNLHYPSLGDALPARRQALGLPLEVVAALTAVPIDLLRGMEADQALPRAVDVSPLADFMLVTVTGLHRHIQATVVRMVEAALREPCQPLPLEVQEAIGHPVEATLSRWRQLSPDRQTDWAWSVAGDVILEGEEAFLAEVDLGETSHV